MIAKDLRDAAEARMPEWVALRREFHRHPELSGQEKHTAERITAYLRKLGYQTQDNVAGHGVVALLEGALPGKTALVRADIDALPIQEQSGVPFASENPGAMHACGHDIHMTVALGVAAVLAGRKRDFTGQVKFVFQPHEEVPPGGAKPMIDAGVLRNPDVHGAFALHAFPGAPVGSVGVRDGVFLAQADDFDIEVIGRGGHCAQPHQGADAVAAACEIVSALQVARTRKIDPLMPAVISIGKITGGTQRNVLCDRVLIEGTARATDPSVAAMYPALIQDTAANVANTFGAEARMTYYPGYPPLVNSPDINSHIRRAGAELWGRDRVIEIPYPILFGEDFAYFAQAVPGALFMLGVGNEAEQAVYPLHHPKFRADERALAVGIATMATAVTDFCRDGT
jgi:amidohydrolase